MKRYTLLALCALVAVGCEQSQTIEENGCGDAIIATDALSGEPDGSFHNGPTTFAEDIILAEPSVIRFDAPRYFYSVSSGPIISDGDAWGPDPKTPFSWPARVMQVDASTLQNAVLVYEAVMPAYSKLVNVTAWVQPAKGHNALPQIRPTMRIYVYDSDSGESKELATISTSATTSAAYEQRTQLQTTLSEPKEITPGKRVLFYVEGEHGNGALPGLVVDSPQFVFTSDGMVMP